MPRKKHSSLNVPMIKTTDAEGRLVIDSKSIETTFDPDGTLTFNKNNGVLAWNCGDITHLNFLSDSFMIMFDAESGVITLTAEDKNIYYSIDKLREKVLTEGVTIEQMEAILEQQEKETNKNAENKENS